MSKPRPRDPFEVIGKIPAKRSYQWVMIAVLGETDLSQVYTMKLAGWRPVPAKRHPEMKATKGQIVVKGQLLMERSIELTHAALRKAFDAARALHKNSSAAPERNSRTGRAIPKSIPAASFSATDYFTQQDVEREKQKLKQVGGRRFVTIPEVNIEISDREIEMALYLKLDPAEYVRRRLLMDTEVLLKVAETDHVPVFARAELSIKPIKGNDYGH